MYAGPESAFDAPLPPTHSSYLCCHEQAGWQHPYCVCPRARESPRNVAGYTARSMVTKYRMFAGDKCVLVPAPVLFNAFWIFFVIILLDMIMWKGSWCWQLHARLLTVIQAYFASVRPHLRNFDALTLVRDNLNAFIQRCASPSNIFIRSPQLYWLMLLITNRSCTV